MFEEEEMELEEPHTSEVEVRKTSNVWRIASFVMVPFVVVGVFMVSLYLMEFDTSPFLTKATSIDDPFEGMEQHVISQGETAAPLTPVTASGGWDVVTAAKESRYGPEMPRGYTPDFFSFKYQPRMFTPPEK